MKNVLVTGATGIQGGSVVDHLLTGDYGQYEVYGLTRDAGSERAQALAARGVHVVEGDMTDRAAMDDLLAGMDAVFLVTTFYEAGPEVETRQGITVAEAAADAGVEQFVYSSVGSADRDTGLAHFESKYAVERRVAELGLPATVVRPTFFMQNFGFMHGAQLAEGRIEMPLAEGVALQMVDADDIGQTVGMALKDPGLFVGERIELAGDELTLEEIAATFSDEMGREITPVRIDLADLERQGDGEMVSMYEWLNDVGYDADVRALGERYGIDARTLREFLAESEAFDRQALAR